MKTWRCLVSAGIVLAAGGWPGRASAVAEASPDPQSLVSAKASPEPMFGVGYHPGNFIGPLAFDFIVRPRPQVAIDVQVGYSSLVDDVHGVGIVPQLQGEFWPGWQTPYVGLVLLYEEVWSEGVTAASEGAGVTGGWQFRWHSGFGIILGGGALYMRDVTVRTARSGYHFAGGMYPTLEIGVRYFF
jgi:hypothetical protein